VQGADVFLFASFPLATRENITVISNSISLSDSHTLALNGPLMHTHSDPSSGLNFRITPNPHTHPDVTVKTPLDWKCLYNIPRNLVIFFHGGFWKILIGGSSRCETHRRRVIRVSTSCYSQQLRNLRYLCCILWSLRCTSRAIPLDRPCPRIKIVRYNFPHGPCYFSTVSSPGKCSLAVSELPTHTINHPPINTITLLLYLFYPLLLAAHHLVTMVIQFVPRLA
jgi:hypothetical protein